MAWKLFTRMVQNNTSIKGFDDGFEFGKELSCDGLDTGVLCGHCKITMETEDYRHFKCPLCEREFLQENS